MVEVQPNDPDFTKELNKLLSFEEYKKLVTKLEERPRYTSLTDPELSEIIEEIKRSA